MNAVPPTDGHDACDCQPAREVEAALQAAPYYALRRVRCRASEGRLVLDGTVPSYYLKQMAQCLLRRRWGSDVAVDNRLEVVPAEVSRG